MLTLVIEMVFVKYATLAVSPECLVDFRSKIILGV